MKYSVVFCTVLCICFTSALDIKDFLGDEPLTVKRVVKEVIEYFKADDPHGIPILEVPEPFDLEGPFVGTTMTLSNISITGHSQLRLDYIDINLELLELELKIRFPVLEILAAHYVWPGRFWMESEGKMNVTFIDLQVGIKGYLGVNNNGLIQLVDMEFIFDKSQFLLDFTGLIVEHSILVSAADTFFDTFILPLIKDRVEGKVMSIANERLEQRLTKSFPVDISPVDFAIAYAKDAISKKLGIELDHFPVKNQEIMLPLGVSLVIKNTFLEGLESLHRTRAIRTEFVDNKIYVKIEIGTQNLKASTDWSLYSSLFPLGSGHADFLIDSFEISLEVVQDADIRHPLIMRSVDVKFGNIALRSAGERNIDYALEALVNLLPNIARNIVLDKRIEGRIKKIAQDKFNAINWEQKVYKILDKKN